MIITIGTLLIVIGSIGYIIWLFIEIRNYLKKDAKFSFFLILITAILIAIGLIWFFTNEVYNTIIFRL
jgi:Trk-type K+ transport system membrane component